jgi:hypothetical protein
MTNQLLGSLTRRCLLVGFFTAGLSLAAYPKDSCLDSLKGNSGNSRFDMAHDLNSQGDSFSCDVEIRASAALSVLEDFRYGFLYDSRPHLERSIHFPLKVTVSQGASDGDQVVLIKDISAWLTFKASHFDPYERALIACANLANVRIYKKWSAFAIGTGRVWFFNSLNFGLRVEQINIAPISKELFQESCVVGVTGK